MRSARELLAAAAMLSTSLFAPQVRAQQGGDAPPPDAPSQGSVPRGAGGAVVRPAQPGAAPAGKATPPRSLNYVPPEYPPEAEKKGLEATVTLQLDITKDGKVEQSVVVDSAGNGFDEAAVAASKRLEFEPARKADGTPVAARILYRYSFTQKKVETPIEPTGPGGAPAAVTHENLRGGVLAAGGDVPIVGASVSVRGGGASFEAKTDDKGAFVFKDVASGKYQVTISAPGYDALSVEETISAGEATIVKYRLLPSGGGLEVTVRGARPPREVTKRTLEQREISRIPGTNGDALRSIQSLPGVARPPGLAGLLIVRGSGPMDTQTFIDGTPVPLIYHFGGLSSVVPTELLDKIDFYPGNFSAQYGRVMGGIVDASIRSPKQDGIHGLAQIDLIDARLMLEGPIPYLKGWSFAAAGRRSYVDAWLGPALKAAGAGVTQAPVYYDWQFLLENQPTPTSKVRLSFFGSDDALKVLIDTPAPGEPALAGNIGLHTAFKRLQARYTNDFANNDKLDVVAALGQDSIDFSLGSLYFLLDIKSVTGRLEYSRKIARGFTLNAGLDVYAGLYGVKVRLPSAPAPGAPPGQPFSTRTVQEQQMEGSAFFPAAFIEAEIAPHPRLKIVPGLRVDYFNVNDEAAVSPRVNARFDVHQPFPRTTLKGGVGVFHQPPQFQEVVAPLGNPKLDSNRAIHYALGVEQEITKQVEASVEGFYKQLDNLVVSSPSPSGASLLYSNIGKGYVVGSEVLLKYKPDDRFFGWLAYTLSRSARQPGPDEPERLVQFDQTHILTVLGSYRLGHGWEVGARFRLVSGNLITPAVCNPSSGTCDPTRTSALFNGGTGTYTSIPYAQPYSERLPLFHQLDIRVDKRWKFKRWELSAYLDVQNVYNNGNSEGLQYNYNYTARQYVSGLPILPSIGLRGEF